MTLAIACLGFFYHTTAFADNIQMLPPLDFNGVSCDNVHSTGGGLLYWDGSNPIRCIPYTSADGFGRVGIGTAPGLVEHEELNVNGYIQLSNFNSAPNYNEIGTNAKGQLVFYGNIRSSNRLRMLIDDDSGNVGIGTPNPQTTLDVNGPIRSGSSGISVGDSCSPEGAQAYDLTNHFPVYCGESGKWMNVSQGFGIGGVYQMYLCTKGDATGVYHPHGTGCRIANPFTGACSCPSGYTAHHFNDFSTGENCPQIYYESKGMVQYSCDSD